MFTCDPAIRTRTLARIVGPYFVAIALALIVRRDDLVQFLPHFMEDAPLVLVTGAFTLIAGLAVITFHHHWNNASAILISMVGILAALKGASLMIAPGLATLSTDIVIRMPIILMVLCGVLLLAGAWLSVRGWTERENAN